MKISDPLGKVYTHTMFKKKGAGGSYDVKESKYGSQQQQKPKTDNAEEGVSEETEEEEEEEDEMEEEEEDEGASVASDQGRDSPIPTMFS
jgi:hypothetical protein